VEPHLVIDIEQGIRGGGVFIADNLPQFLQVLVGNSADDQIGHADFQDQPEFKGIPEGALVQDIGNHRFLQDLWQVGTLDQGALMLDGFDQTHRLEPVQGFPDYRAAHPHHLGQFQLLGNHITRAQFLLDEEIDQIHLHLVHKAPCIHGPYPCYHILRHHILILF